MCTGRVSYVYMHVCMRVYARICVFMCMRLCECACDIVHVCPVGPVLRAHGGGTLSRSAEAVC